MKYKILTVLIAASLCSYAQTADNKNFISAGYGTQNYNGVLANTWFNFKYQTYGVATITYSRYLCSSFDVSGYVTAGNFGHCRDGYSLYWPDGETELNMKGQLITINAVAKYKFANGYILKEDARIAPFIYVGVGADPLLNWWWSPEGQRVVPGVYYSVVSGAGFKYNFNSKFSFTYTITFGCFNNDKMDFGNLYSPTPMNPMFMQNVYTIGYSF